MGLSGVLRQAPARIGVIDLIRGVALLGIVAINMTGFWGPLLATFNPHLPRIEPGADAWFAVAFVLFEGKMRALFTLLFGASMELFLGAAARRLGEADTYGWRPVLVQARRLLWLAVFGYAHYLLFWWGDILFPYALCGLLALALGKAGLGRVGAVPLALLGLGLFALPHGLDAIGDLMGMATEQQVLGGRGLPGDVADQAAMMQRIAISIGDDMRVTTAPFVTAIVLRLRTAPWLPFATTGATFTETFPLILMGMALLRGGFFTGGWSRRALRITAIAGIGGGGALALVLIGWAWRHGFPPRAMFAIMGSLSAPEHLAMALGYAALPVLFWPRIATSRATAIVAAAGRTAFTNYLGTTIVMGAFFSGWGLGLAGRLARGWLPGFVVLGWMLILLWPRFWLARRAQGPLERLWRGLTWFGIATPRPLGEDLSCATH